MTKEEMTRIILSYELEMREYKNEMSDALGDKNEYTERVTAQWLAVEELLIRLNLKEE